MAIRSYREASGALARLLYTKLGDAALPEIAAVFAELGRATGEKMRRDNPTAGFQTVMESFFGPAVTAGRAVVVEATDRTYEGRSSRCTLGLEGAGRSVCEAVMALDQETLAAACGRPLTMEIKRTMAAGDDCCQVRFSIKDEGPSAAD